MSRIENRLRELSLELPQPSRPGANYVTWLRSGALVFLSGQLCHWNGERRYIGKLGREFGDVYLASTAETRSEHGEILVTLRPQRWYCVDYSKMSF